MEILDSGRHFTRYRFSQVASFGSSEACQQTEVDSEINNHPCRVFSFLPVRQRETLVTTVPAPCLHGAPWACMPREAFELRQSSEQYRPSPFTSNYSGYMGQIRFAGRHWQSAFVKVGSQARYESSMFLDASAGPRELPTAFGVLEVSSSITLLISATSAKSSPKQNSSTFFDRRG